MLDCGIHHFLHSCSEVAIPVCALKIALLIPTHHFTVGITIADHPEQMAQPNAHTEPEEFHEGEAKAKSWISTSEREEAFQSSSAGQALSIHSFNTQTNNNQYLSPNQADFYLYSHITLSGHI